MSYVDERDRMISRIIKVIRSCKNPDQLQVAKQYIRLASRRDGFNYWFLLELMNLQ